MCTKRRSGRKDWKCYVLRSSWNTWYFWLRASNGFYLCQIPKNETLRLLHPGHQKVLWIFVHLKAPWESEIGNRLLLFNTLHPAIYSVFRIQLQCSFEYLDVRKMEFWVKSTIASEDRDLNRAVLARIIQWHMLHKKLIWKTPFEDESPTKIGDFPLPC